MTFEAVRPSGGGDLLIHFNIRGITSLRWHAMIPHGQEDAEYIRDCYIERPRRNRAAFDEWWRQYRGVFKPEERE